MLSKYLDKEKIIEAYSGDGIWLDEIENQILKILNSKTINLTSEELKQLGKARELIIILNKMNYIVVETESKEYFGKYNIEIYELYSEMKIDLTKMLGIEDIWEEM